MTETPSERRLAENEVIFRRANLEVRNGLKNLKKQSEAEGLPHLYEDDLDLHFYCECSDDKCRKRIVLKPSEYDKYHKNTKQFIIVPGHATLEIERIIVKKLKFEVVEKFIDPPIKAKRMHSKQDQLGGNR